MNIVDKLLTKYVDKLNSGQEIDIATLLEECPQEYRIELSELIEMVKIFKRNSDFLTINPRKKEDLFLQLEEIIQSSRNEIYSTKLVANFRNKNIDKNKQDSLNKKLTRIFKDEFGEE